MELAQQTKCFPSSVAFHRGQRSQPLALMCRSSHLLERGQSLRVRLLFMCLQLALAAAEQAAAAAIRSRALEVLAVMVELWLASGLLLQPLQALCP